MLEEIEFHRLSKLKLEVDEPENMCVVIAFNCMAWKSDSFRFDYSDTYGHIFAYDKSTYDRITTKTERPLHPLDRIKYNTTTSDDPVIQRVSVGDLGGVYLPIPQARKPKHGNDLCNRCYSLGSYVCSTVCLSLGHCDH